MTLSAAWFFHRGYILYYGDAQAHLNISRSIIDSRTPGYHQLGNVWLPVLHLICLPFAGNDWLWTTGLAGTIPVSICFVTAGTCFYFAAKATYGSSIAAVVVVCCFALNPNLLYLAVIPMTEVVFLFGLGVFLFSLLRFHETQRGSFISLGVLASWFMSLTRYDGWFLIPFSAIAFTRFAKHRRLLILVGFAALAGLAPLYWMAHNWWATSNPLDFYNGPYSAAAIQGSIWYPGYHDWKIALKFYSNAGQLCSGWPLVLLATVGIVCAAIKRIFVPILFLLLTPIFYVWSIHSSKTPIYLPKLWFNSYYNSRYGIAVVVLCAFAAGAVALVLPLRVRVLALLLPVVSVMPWLWKPSEQNWICWKESEVNSISRRAWTNAAAEFLTAHYEAGQGILAPSGDVAGIFCRARIHLEETLNEEDGPAWLANSSRPDLVHQNLWVVALAGDFVSKAIKRERVPVYRIAKEIRVEGAPPLEIYRRGDK
jgi:hypothetical protein